MSLTILLEIGHDASLRSKISPEGFTHDWEVFVKGQNNAEIHYYVEKVVFHLHETFPKPKRVVKDPPFSLRTSGYAGFKLPIEIYLKNNSEPKKIKFNYDLHLQPAGSAGPPIHLVQKEKYTFFNPSEEFRIKLLKGGAVEGSGNQENSVNRVVSEERNQMTSKPKLSGSDITKKHKMKFDEPRTTDFENLFGPPIKKNSKLPEPPKPREPPPATKPSNPEKSSDKEKSDKSKSNKSIHKDKDKEKSKEKSSDSSDKKNKDEKKKLKDEKSKDKERSKERSSKKDKEREKSPLARPRSPTPKRSPKRDPSPPVQKHNSSKEKESSKDERKDKEREKEKKEEKKSKKDKRDHKEGKHKDREKDKEHREHKSKDKDRDKSSRDKESSYVKTESSPLPPASLSSQTTHKTDKKPKDKEHSKEQSKEDEKPDRIEKTDKPEKLRTESDDRQNKHKHKKKDRKEKKEEKHSKKDEKKNEKQPSSTSISKDASKDSIPMANTNRETDKSSSLFGSPKSISPPTPKESEIKIENNTMFSRDDESSNDSVKLSSREASPAPRIPSKSPSPLPPPEPIKKLEPEKKKEQSPKKKEKKEKKKDKKVDKDHEKKKKRKSDSTTPLEMEPPEKVVKVEENNSDEESKVSSTEDTTAMIQPKSEYDMDMLRDLQHKIMSLKDNADLQRVVQLIAETGQYEVSAHTFDFDLCLLDRSTVRQLQDFFSTIS